MKSVCLSLPTPISANRYWRTRTIKGVAMTYVSAEAKQFKKTVEQLARAAGVTKPIEGRVMVEIWMYPRRPLDWQKRQRQLGAHWDDGVNSLDLDNITKPLLDALKDIVMEDDKFVFKIASMRMEPDAKGARTLVRITKIEPDLVQADLPGYA